MSRGGLILVVVLLALAVAVGLASDSGTRDSATPSIDNRGPRGLAVLATWLSEHGTVRRASAPFSELDPEVRTIVIAAPSSAEISNDEQVVLEKFVRGGGTLVYLAPRDFPQPAMNRWLDLTRGELAPVKDEDGDQAGTTAAVTFNGGLTARVKALRLAADRQVRSNLEEALPVAEFGALWFIPQGAGEIWVGSGADLAENARLDALDNARFWSTLAARGPVLFDEYHHLASAAVRAPPSQWATGLQFALCAVFFVLVFGPRLGPAREPAPRVHRSSLEYVRAMAGLARRSKVEPELVEAIRKQARHLALERLGVPIGLSWDEAALAVRARLAVAAPAFEAIGRTTDFVETSAAAARFERALLGLS